MNEITHPAVPCGLAPTSIMVWKAAVIGALLAVLALLMIVPDSARAYQTWSLDPVNDTGNCATCHGKYGFAGKKYVSAHDGTVWSADLMTGHGQSMLTGCLECHAEEGDQPLMSRCTGCHGREEDGGVMRVGAGLRQHHRQAGIGDCDICHGSSEKAVGENVVPAGMKAKGIDPCHDVQFGPDGLDNDGDGLYDADDPDCQVTADGADAATQHADDH